MSQRYRVGDAPVSDAEALAVACPECEAQPENPCVYVWPKGVNPDAPWHSPGVRARIDQVGKPTRKAHNARRGAAHAARRVRPTPTTVRVSLIESELRGILNGEPLHESTREKLEMALWRLGSPA